MKENKKKKLLEDVITGIILFTLPIIAFLIIYIFFKRVVPQGLVIYCSLMFGYGFSTVFSIGWIIAGLFNDSFLIVTNRIKTFFEDLSISFKFAFENYIFDLKNDGVAFWIHLGIIVLNVVIFIISLNGFLDFNSLL